MFPRILSLALMNVIESGNNQQINHNQSREITHLPLGSSSETSESNFFDSDTILTPDNLNLDIKKGDEVMKKKICSAKVITKEEGVETITIFKETFEEILCLFVSFVEIFEEETKFVEIFEKNTGEKDKNFYVKLDSEYLPLFGLYTYFFHNILQLNFNKEEFFRIKTSKKKNKYVFSSPYFKDVKLYQQNVNVFFNILKKFSLKFKNKGNN